MKKFLIFSALLTFGILFFFTWLEYSATALKKEMPEPVVFEVFTGENALVIGKRLEAAGLVESRLPFLWYLARERKLHSFLAGRYKLSGSLTAASVADTLTGGGVLSRDVRVTFPEGFTAKQMTERLSASGLPGAAVQALIENPRSEWRTQFPYLAELPPGSSLEGFLFPDTYFFAPDATTETIVLKLLENFGVKVETSLRTALSTRAGDFYQALTLASIVEQEVRSEQDRKLVSDLFLRRLKTGQALQSDATVKYILGVDKIQHSVEETRTPSLYNTYLHPGLPPGPIANPGLVSLRAVAYAEANPYVYFLSNPETGVTVFAKTFEEHIRNKAANGL